MLDTKYRYECGCYGSDDYCPTHGDAVHRATVPRPIYHITAGQPCGTSPKIEATRQECSRCFGQIRWHRISFRKGIRLPGYDLVARCVGCKELYRNATNEFLVATTGNAAVWGMRESELEKIAFLDCVGDSVPAEEPKPGPEADAVNHPPHYGGADDPYEAIKVIEAWELNFNLGNTLKYVCRYGRKDADEVGLEDLKKARWYLDREIQNLEKSRA